MSESIINWRKEDFLKLGKAVSQFNKKLKELDRDSNRYLPDFKEYKEIRDNILSRKELNRVISSLRKFSKEGMNEKVELPSGQIISKWEYNQLKLSRNRVVTSLSKEKEEIIEGRKWVGMGSERVSQIESIIDNISSIESLKGSEFKKTSERISFLGRKDIALVRAEQFRENFMNSLEEMSTYDNYSKLYYKLANIDNPISFYNYVRKSETLSDLFLYYKDKATSNTYGGFDSNQEAFDYALEELGIL